MAVVAIALIIVGLFVMAYGSLPIFVQAFRTSLAWGLGSLFLPVGLVFVMKNWEQARRWFFIALFGWVILLAGAAILFLSG